MKFVPAVAYHFFLNNLATVGSLLAIPADVVPRALSGRRDYDITEIDITESDVAEFDITENDITESDITETNIT